MRPKFFPTIIIASLCLVSSSCKKDKEQSKTDMLTTGQWKVNSFTISPAYDVDGDGVVDSDLYALMDDCDKDDSYVFKDNGKYEINDGAIKCDPLEPQVEVLDWSFANNETELIIDGDRATIQELSNSKLRLRGNVFGRMAEVTFVK